MLYIREITLTDCMYQEKKEEEDLTALRNYIDTLIFGPADNIKKIKER